MTILEKDGKRYEITEEDQKKLFGQVIVRGEDVTIQNIMTKDEFEQAYAKRSGITLEQLREINREARPCDCGDELCQGWQMVNVKDEQAFSDFMKQTGAT
jgi:hypothetical protein